MSIVSARVAATRDVPSPLGGGAADPFRRT
jgi:hypothetical protein